MKAEKIVSCVCAFLPAELRGIQRKLNRAGLAKLDEVVHDARKSIKKLRAALRLVEAMAPEKAVADFGAPLRKAAHTLGPVRDHLVLKETARRLSSRGETPPPETVAPAAQPILKQVLGICRKPPRRWCRCCRKDSTRRAREKVCARSINARARR